MIELTRNKVLTLPGPILVLGAGGFIGSNLFRSIMHNRTDVYGTSRQASPWRISDVSRNQLRTVNLLVNHELEELLREIKPKTIFNCVAYGAYSFQEDWELIYETNFTFLVNLLEKCSAMGIHSFIQAGTSSEYGSQSAGPVESLAPAPNSHYAVSKCAAANAIYYMGRERGLPCTNLRIYSAYGPFEDSSRLIPQLVIRASEGRLPDFVDAKIGRDFVYIDDVVEAFISAAINLTPAYYGHSFNIGTGKCTTIGELANLARTMFDIKDEPSFSMQSRDWDVVDWFAHPQRANEVLDWCFRTELSTGLLNTKAWYGELGHLVNRLKDKKHLKIRAVDNKPLDQWFQSFSNVENLELDLRLLENCRKSADNCSQIYNLAADMGGMGFIEKNKTLCMRNVLINTHLLQAAQESGVNKYFYSSSACVYAHDKQISPNNSGLKESDAYPAMPEDGYGWEKLFSEHMCRHYREDFGMETRIARYHNVYGPYGSWEGGREKAPAAICRKVIDAKLKKNGEIEIWGDGQQTRSFTYIDDCTKGTEMLLNSNVIDPINLGSSEMVTINQLVDIVEEIAKIRLRRLYNLNAPKGVRGRSSENTMIQDRLGWAPSTPLVEGMRKTYAWVYDQMKPRYA